MPGCMANSGDDNPLTADEVSHIVWKSRNVDEPVAQGKRIKNLEGRGDRSDPKRRSSVCL